MASATTRPSTAMTVANGYSPSRVASRDSAMQRCIIARSVGSAIFWDGDTVVARGRRIEALPRNGHDGVAKTHEQVFNEDLDITQIIPPDASASIAPRQVYS